MIARLVRRGLSCCAGRPCPDVRVDDASESLVSGAGASGALAGKKGYRLTEVQQLVLEQVRGLTARTHNPREWLDADFNKAFVALLGELQCDFTPEDI